MLKQTKVTLAALTVVTMALTGCGADKADPAQPATTTGASSAPAGNGVAALGADEILQRAKDALKQAKSFRAKGTVVDEGQQTAIDLRISGADFLGSMSLGTAKVELLAVGGEKFLRPSAEFLTMATDPKQGKALAKSVGGRWIAGADNDQAFAGLFTVGSVDELLKPTGALSKGEEKEIGGVPAIGLKDAGDPDSVLWVATKDEAYPLQLTGKGGSTLVFSAFGETFTGITKPAANEVVDLGKAAGGR